MPPWDRKRHKVELRKLKQFFSKISSVLEDFADAHNLEIDNKSYHQFPFAFPAWSFFFSHPKGGFGQIQVKKKDEHGVEVYPVYWINEHKTGKTFTKVLKRGEQCSLDPKTLREMLEKTLKLVLSWDIEDAELYSLNTDCWKEMTKEQFEQSQPRYPIPKYD